MQQQRLKRFRSDLQNARRLLQEFAFVRGGDIAVPMPDGDVRFLAQVVQAIELIVDEGLERSDVERSHAGGRIFPKQREDGEEGGFRLSRGGLGGEQDVLVGIEDSVRCGDLDGAQALPRVAVDEVLHKRCVSVERAHVPSFHR